MSKQECIQRFSDQLFWDVDRVSVDMETHAPFVVRRVLEYGNLEDWNLLLSFFGKESVVEVCKRLRSLEPRALAFVCTVLDTPKEEFRCYNTRQSNPEHCNF